MCVIIVVFRRVVSVFKQTQNENVVFNFFPNHIQMKYIAKPKQEKSVLVFSVIAVGLMDYMNWLTTSSKRACVKLVQELLKVSDRDNPDKVQGI